MSQFRNAVFAILTICLLAFPAQAKYGGGNGSAENPYRIATPNDLNEIGANPDDWDAHFVMVNDINLADYTGTQFNLIGDYEGDNPFTGVFDGNGFTIFNFTYETNSTDFIGLFGYLGTNGKIRKLSMQNVSVDAGTGRYIGGMVGLIFGGRILHSCTTGTISGGLYVGGLVGISDGTISNSYAAGIVSGNEFLGGLAGVNYGELSQCCTTGTVEGNQFVGGLIGGNDCGTITNCYATNTVEGNSYVGGLIGDSTGIISNCYATGSITGTEQNTGGLVGNNSGTISHCYAKGSVKGIWAVGGLVGENGHATISNSFSKSNTEGDCAVGGLVGSNRNGTIYNSYAAGSVTGNDRIGGLLGQIDVGTYISSFWDSTVNPLLTGIGNGSDPNVIGKKTAEMQTESTFTDVGWDFVEIWNIGENQTYPYLRVYPAGDLNHDNIVDFLDFAIFAKHWLQGVE